MVAEVIGAGLGIAGSLFGGKKQKKAAKKQKKLIAAINAEAVVGQEAAKKSFEIQQQIADIQALQAKVAARRDRIEFVREARIRRGQLLSSVNASGAGLGSSAIAGGLSSMGSQFAGGLNLFANASRVGAQLSDLAKQDAIQQGIILDSQGRISQLKGQGEIAQAKGNLGAATGNFISTIGAGISAFSDIKGGLQNLLGGTSFKGV